jgi:ADP-ribose pyrophosphatase YjhB (NUDIX family)
MDQHCPACGGALTKRTLEGHERQVCGDCGRVHYRNSKPCVGAVIVLGDHVLLSRRAGPPLQGAWDLLGGFLEAGEHPLDGLRRELREEAGLTLVEADLLGIWMGDYQGHPTLNLVYRCTVEGQPKAADDSAEVRWWPLAALPRDLAWPHEREALALAARR